MEMEAKEKSKEMVNLFLNKKLDFIYQDSDDGACVGTTNMTHNSAKECALIAVNQIINSHQDDYKTKENSTYWHPCDYWMEVKSEIEKLN